MLFWGGMFNQKPKRTCIFNTYIYFYISAACIHFFSTEPFSLFTLYFGSFSPPYNIIFVHLLAYSFLYCAIHLFLYHLCICWQS